MVSREMVWLVAALLLAGCSAIPDSKSANSQDSSDPTRSSNSEIPPYEASDLIALPDPLSSGDASRIALERSPNLSAAKSRIEAANASVRQAQGGYYPWIDLDAGMARTRQSLGAFNIPGFSGANRYTTYSASLSANWILFDGLAREARIAGSEADVLQTLAAFDDVRRLLIQSVELAYNNALLAKESIRTAEADAGFNRALLEETRIKVEAGQAALSERLNFEVRVNVAQSQLVTARSDLRLALTALAELMGLPESITIDQLHLETFDREQSATVALPDEMEEVAFALANRPDLEALRHAITASEARIDETVAANIPTLFVQGRYGYQRNDDAHFDEKDLTMTGSLNLAWNLFSGFSDAAATRVAESLSDEARKGLATQWLAVISEVRQAVTLVQLASEQLALRQKNYELTLETRDLVTKEYSAGQASLVRLNEAQRDLTEADALYSRASVGLRYSMENLDAATARNLAPR